MVNSKLPRSKSRTGRSQRSTWSGTLTSLDICIRGVHCERKVQVGQHYIHDESERVDGAHRISERESL